MDYSNIDFSFDALESKLLHSEHRGIEIDYDPDFLELENMVAVKAEQQYGDTIIPATPIDWSKTLTKACELLNKSRDYRLCCIITRALTHKYGVRGTLKGIDAIRLLTEHCWNECFPSTVYDGEADFFPRANAIAELNSNTGLLGDLRASEIKLGASGKLSIGRIEKILSGRVDNEDYTREQLLQILQNEALADNSELLAIKELHTQVVALEQQLSLLFGSDQAPDFGHLKNLLSQANPIHYSDSPIEVQPIDEDPVSLNLSINQQELSAISGQIKSRTDAIKTLDKVCEFLEKNDPSNPAPLLIKRARNMIGQDFFTILSQLAPDAIAQAEQVTGTQL
ncbi:type VI secretion system protein TssA [Cellvibrio sp. OA-2007]|uniref:type VI secretion system protein TssA n=1 Tax=Cellvibrio sp. OA-2007 TaxID=529823 RepID=UPI00078191D9|nr:type VI secretion system ImpA family N-terminal domain-containing protein [Cellvibrio sp. OA-2007]